MCIVFLTCTRKVNLVLIRHSLTPSYSRGWEDNAYNIHLHMYMYMYMCIYICVVHVALAWICACNYWQSSGHLLLYVKGIAEPCWTEIWDWVSWCYTRYIHVHVYPLDYPILAPVVGWCTCQLSHSLWMSSSKDIQSFTQYESITDVLFSPNVGKLHACTHKWC